MANEQVRVDLTANDKASRTIDDVADSAEKLEKLDPEVEVTADDKASRTLDDVADSAEKLDRLAPEVAIGVDDNASSAIAGVAEDADKLTRADHELVLKARIDDARAQLKGLRDDLDTTADKTSEVDRRLDKIGRSEGPGLAGNAVSDLTGPLGDVSSKASDIAGVFDGLADVSANMASRVGLDAEKMAGSITGIGFAITAAAAVWAFYKQRQDEARRKQEELTKKTQDWLDALRQGDRAGAISKITDQYEELLRTADRLGVLDEVTAAITGQTDAVPKLDKAISDLQRAYTIAMTSGEGNLTTISETLDAYKKLKDDVEGASGAVDGATDALTQHDRIVGAVTRSLDGAARNTDKMATASEQAERKVNKLNAELDRLQGGLDIEQASIDFERAFTAAVDSAGESAIDTQSDVLAMKQSVLDTGETLKKNPLEIQTVLNKVESGDLVGAYNDVQRWFDERPVFITIGAKTQRLGFTPIGGGQIVIDTTAAPTIGTLNMTLPAGWRGDPVRAAHVQRRRAGRYYARTA